MKLSEYPYTAYRIVFHWDYISRLADFKRSSTKNWMMLKFGGLLECAEKATVSRKHSMKRLVTNYAHQIVGELGKLVIEVCYHDMV